MWKLDGCYLWVSMGISLVNTAYIVGNEKSEPFVLYIIYIIILLPT